MKAAQQDDIAHRKLGRSEQELIVTQPTGSGPADYRCYVSGIHGLPKLAMVR